MTTADGISAIRDRIKGRVADGTLSSSAVDDVLAFLARVPLGCFIDGEVRETDSAFDVLDPATGEVLCAVSEAGQETVGVAVRAAKDAYPAWRDTSARVRGELLWKLADAVERHQQQLALLESLDTGKLLVDALAIDVPQTIAHLRYFAGWATKVEGRTIPVSAPGLLNYTVREPVGVVAGIIPWNYPLTFAAYKIAAPTGFGNTVCLKPAEQTPLSALYLARLVHEVGFPRGVVNVLPGFGSVTGAALTEHPEVAKVAFTGSVETGKRIARAATGTLKRVSLELGGKSPNIVFDDADLDAAIAGAFGGAFHNHGQVCTAGSRLFVHDGVYDQVVRALVDEVKAVRLGHGLDAATTMGPLVSAEQQKKVLSYIAGEEGKVLVGGPDRQGGYDPEGGYFVTPTLFEVTGDNSTALERDEIFGPVATISRFHSVDEVVRQANDTRFGLAAGVWTKDISRAHKLARALDSGTVWVNTYNMFDAASPIGGRKMSGLGRELGAHSIELYTEPKSVWIGVEAD